MTFTRKFHALQSTARIPNLPSVVVNVWTGIVCGVMTVDDTFRVLSMPWHPFLMLAAAGVSLYGAGNFLNDWMDRDWDRIHRPERALPAGEFAPGLYLAMAVACGLTGLGLATAIRGSAGITALGILSAIVIYTVWHKKTPWAVIPMGLCRALLPIMGALGVSGQLSLLPAVFAMGLLCHIAGLSLSARYESLANPPAGIARLARLLFAATTGLAIWVAASWSGKFAAVSWIPYGVWILLCLTLWRKPVPLHVSKLLAGIPLADGIVLLAVFSGLAASGAGASPLALGALLMPPLAFVLAILLQRLAPAT
jgi:4-hydroxybenzoate polyprenyltransferase